MRRSRGGDLVQQVRLLEIFTFPLRKLKCVFKTSSCSPVPANRIQFCLSTSREINPGLFSWRGMFEQRIAGKWVSVSVDLAHLYHTHPRLSSALLSGDKQREGARGPWARRYKRAIKRGRVTSLTWPPTSRGDEFVCLAP